MSIAQLPTATMQLHVDYYDPDKGARRYSSTIMSPMSVNIDVPMNVPNRDQILALLDSSKENGEPLELEFVTGTDRYKNTLLTVYSAKTVKPLNNQPKP